VVWQEPVRSARCVARRTMGVVVGALFLTPFSKTSMSSDGRIRVFALKRIDAAYIHQKGFEEARRAKDLLWSTKVSAYPCRLHAATDSAQFAEARAEKKSDNMWSLMRAAETEVRTWQKCSVAIVLRWHPPQLWIYMSDENEENRALAEKAMSETLEFIAYVKNQTEKPGFFSFGEHELGPMRAVLEAHAVSIEAFATLGLAILEFRKKAYLSGGYHLRSSWKAFESAQQMQKEVPPDKVLTDIITFGLGFFALAISLLPPTFQWVAEFIGFKANREEGQLAWRLALFC
jgi:hypothetical protein